MPAPVVTAPDAATAVAAAREFGVRRAAPVALSIAADGVALATSSRAIAIRTTTPAACASAIDAELHPRWVLWSGATAAEVLAGGGRLSTAWDLVAVHRLLFGGWRADPVRVWSLMHGLDHHDAPSLGQLDLLGAPTDDGGDPDRPVQADGYLRPEWVAGCWKASCVLAAEWARAAAQVAVLQHERLVALRSRHEVAGDAEATARAESTAELLCAELAHGGLPVDLAAAERLLTELVGPAPAGEAEAEEQRRRRDDDVLRHLPPGSGIDLRNPADVRTMLRRLGIDVPDTRAWRLEAMRDTHPAVDALLRWRKAERVATTFGYGWLAAHVGSDGRLRGEWAGSDGAAGRMTAQAGLHNMPAELRPIVVAEPGHVFVRADLGQIEPRVLAAVSGDPALMRATQSDDLYLPVARRLHVERSVAKVAVLAAMYGQTSGTAGQALRGLEAAYPVAMRYLADAAHAGVEGRELRTFGGRRIPMFSIDAAPDHRAAAAARGRYARNAMVQGAAAELFKVWAVTVRARGREVGAQIVLCLHDELLVHVPEDRGAETAELLVSCLAEAAHRWHRSAGVRFVADVAIVRSWADAKA